MMEAIHAGSRSELDPSTLSARDVVEAAAAGDTLADSVWRETIALLAAAIASLVNAFDPDLVVLGGGLTGAGDRLFVPLRELVATHSMPILGRRTPILPAALGAAVGVVGAAVAAMGAEGTAG
jgi:glucokinase